MGRDKPSDTVSGNPPADDCWDGPAPQPIDPKTGQHGDHWVLPEEERKKGFVRPVRTSYIHEKCGTTTTMPRGIAETYARDPKYYGSTFCCGCRNYLPVREFRWKDGTTVGS